MAIGNGLAFLGLAIWIDVIAVAAAAGTGYLQTATGAANRPPAYFLDPVYQGFLKGVVVPNIDVFAGLTVCGEMTFGLLLAVGLCTPVAALGAMFLHFNYFNMKS